MAYKYKHFIPQNIAPSGAKSVGVYDSNGNKICSVALGRLAPPTKEKLYSFGLVSDIHLYKDDVSWVTWNPNEKFDNALSSFEDEGCLFCVVCGDLTQTGLYTEDGSGGYYLDESQFAKYKEVCDSHTIPVYELMGNHESYYSMPITDNLDKMETYTGKGALSYTIEQGNDLFVLLGQPSGSVVMSDEDLEWLESLLADNQDKRCFVFVHSYIEEDSGDAKDLRENSIFDDGYWGATKRNAFMDLLDQHDNVILFHGHSHIKFEYQEVDRNANYTEKNGFKSVHIPSLGRPRDVDVTASATPYADNEAQGYIVDVYDDCIVLNGWDFINDQCIPLGIYKVDTTIEEV